MKSLFIQVAVALFVVLVAMTVIELWPSSGAFGESISISVVEALYLIGLPLAVGIIMGQCFRYVQRRRTRKVRFSEIIGSLRNSRETYLSLFISPLVFFVVFQTSKASPDAIQTVAFSFQNGFFINHLMATLLQQGKRDFGGESESSNGSNAS